MFQALVAGVKVQAMNEETWRYPIDIKSQVMIETLALKEDQAEDEDIGPVLSVLRDKVDSDYVDIKSLLEGSKRILRERKCLFIDQKGILRRKSGNFDQVVLPAKHRDMIYKSLHVEMVHLGADRVFQLARKRVYWPYMQRDIEEFTQRRCRCIIQRKPHREQF